MKITLNFSWDLDGLRLEGQNLGPFLIIIFCYCPKHCFRLIEGQQSTGVGVKISWIKQQFEILLTLGLEPLSPGMGTQKAASRPAYKVQNISIIQNVLLFQYSSMKKKIGKIWLIFDIEKWLFLTFHSKSFQIFRTFVLLFSLIFGLTTN